METKDSWRIGDAGFTVFGPKTDKPSPVTIAKLVHKEYGPLVAAAPDLLAALKDAERDIVQCLSDSGWADNKINADSRLSGYRATIAKAEGHK